MNRAKTYRILIAMDPNVIITAGGRHRCQPGNWVGSGDWSDIVKLYAPRTGRAWLAVDGRRTDLHPHRLYLIPPHHRLTYAATPEMVVDWLHFLPVSPLMDLQLAARGEVATLPAKTAARWQPVTGAIPEFFAAPSPALRCRMHALVLDVVGEALAAGPAIESTTGEWAARLLPAVRFMDDHVIDPPPLAVIAAQVNLSPEHFHRRYRALYRTTPFEYIQRRRMAQAHRLLTEGALTVKEVAAACGYDDPYYFSRMFRRQYACSPRDVRLGKAQPVP